MRSALVACCLALPALLLGAPGCAVDAPQAEEDVESESDSAYSVAVMPAEVNRRVATCFARDWSTRELSVTSDRRYSTNIFVSSVGTAISSAIRSIGYVVMIGSEGEAVLRQLEADLKQLAEEQRLEDHQKAIVVSCVSSQLLTYAFNAISKYLGAAAAVGEYEGVCTEYSHVYVRLLRALGVDAGVLPGMFRSGGHAWSWVEIGGRTLWIEPQTNPLRFGGAFFIDPEGKAPATPTGLMCLPSPAGCSRDSDCCSGRCAEAEGSRTCAQTACESAGSRICAPTSESCTSIGGTPDSASCGSSIDGATCCALGS